MNAMKQRRIIGVEYHSEYKLIVLLQNGARYLFDLSGDIAKGGEMVIPLRDIEYFKKAQVTEHGTIEWPNGYDVCPDAVIGEGRLISRPNHKDDCPCPVCKSIRGERMKKTGFLVQFPPELRKEIEEVARRRNTSQGEIVRRAVSDWLKREARRAS
jgi:hypothetical protein